MSTRFERKNLSLPVELRVPSQNFFHCWALNCIRSEVSGKPSSVDVQNMCLLALSKLQDLLYTLEPAQGNNHVHVSTGCKSQTMVFGQSSCSHYLHKMFFWPKWKKDSGSCRENRSFFRCWHPHVHNSNDLFQNPSKSH